MHQDVIHLLQNHAPELRRLGVSALFLFGSTARGTARDDSDVDLFFDYDNPRFSLIELVDVQERIEKILGRKSDVMTRTSLHPLIRPAIEKSAVRVF